MSEAVQTNMSEAVQGPLAGIRVVDLTRILAGPLCTMMLGDMGADVIKVEPPDKGDDTRAWGPPFVASEAAYFLGVNRNKRSLTLNMAVPGRAENPRRPDRESRRPHRQFPDGHAGEMGLHRSLVRATAPRLVRCSITGYGSSGPKAALPGYDFILQAESGLMSICGERDGGPTKYGVAIVDVCTGMLAGNSILAALNARDRTGKGQKVELSLYETSLSMLINVASNYLAAGRNGGRFGNGHPSIVPYTTYRAADAMIALAIGNERQFARAAEVLGHPEWAKDTRFASNRARVENRTVIDGLINVGACPRYGRRLARQAPGGGCSLRQDQFGRRRARRSAHRRARHDRDGRASHHRRVEDARHSVQVLRHRLLGAARAADARAAQR